MLTKCKTVGREIETQILAFQIQLDNSGKIKMIELDEDFKPTQRSKEIEKILN